MSTTCQTLFPCGMEAGLINKINVLDIIPLIQQAFETECQHDILIIFVRQPLRKPKNTNILQWKEIVNGDCPDQSLVFSLMT